MKIKRIKSLLWYTVKDFFHTFEEVFMLFKKAKTWNFILYGAFIYCIYNKRSWLESGAVLGILFIIYLIRQNREPDFNKMMKDKAFVDNDDDVTRKFYRRYEEECFHSRPQRQPLEYEEWKQKEKTKIMEKKHIELEQDDTGY